MQILNLLIGLALTAEAEYAVIQASQTISPTARPETARPSTASSVQSSTIAKFIPRLLDAIDNERTYVEDEFQARVCLGWLHWHLGEPALAAGRLPKNIGQEFAQLDGTNKESVGWTKVCALKAAYIKGNSQVKTGAVADALETFESSLPIFTSISTTANHSSQLKTWAELYLTGFCMVSSQAVKSKTTSILETETLSAFRTWAKFWEAQTAKWVGGRAHGAEVSRRHVWKEYYVVLSNLLRDDLPFPTTSLTTTYSSSTKFHQHTELKRIETRYKALILAELQFPKAEEVNEEVEEFVELVMQNWRIICGSDWKDYDLGEGGAEAVSRNVLDTLYDAATKTFHSTPILRHLFTVHLAVADFELAYKAFDTYLEIVKKGKLRVEKTGESEPSLDNDEIVLGAASECIKSLCRYGTMDAAEKAHELGVYFETWLDKQHAAHTVNDDQDAQTNGRTSSAPQQFTPKVMALAWRCIGIAHAQWARFTYDAGSRTEIQIHALKCFRKALHPDFESQTDVDTLFALGTLLAERREISAAIEVVKVGLQPPKSTSTDNNITGSRAAPFSRERSLIPLWHLLALLLSARQEFMTAARACEGAFEQFQDPRNLFGDASLNTPYRSDHLRMNEKSTARLQGIVDDMNDFERENVLEVKMTQLSLIEILEGPDVAVNASEELLGLYARLFGDPRKDAVVQTRPETAALSPPKSSAGTIRSIKGSIFGRSNRSIRKTSRTTPPAAEKSSVAMRPQTSQTLASARGPSIQVTHENGSAGKQHHHLTKDPPQEKPGRTTSISKKRASGSARTRSTSAGKRSSEHTTTIVDGEKFFTPPVDAEHRDDWLEDGNPANAGSGAASVKNADLPRRLPSNAQSMPQREKSLKSSRNEAGNVQNNPLPRISPYSSSTSPVTRFPKDQEQRRRTSTLIKVWLLIAGFYRRARMYDDSRGAIEEAHKLAQKLELDVTNDITGHVTISNSGWGGGKSSGELLGDVFAEVSCVSYSLSSSLVPVLTIQSVATWHSQNPYRTPHYRTLNPL